MNHFCLLEKRGLDSCFSGLFPFFGKNRTVKKPFFLICQNQSIPLIINNIHDFLNLCSYYFTLILFVVILVL